MTRCGAGLLEGTSSELGGLFYMLHLHVYTHIHTKPVAFLLGCTATPQSATPNPVTHTPVSSSHRFLWKFASPKTQRTSHLPLLPGVLLPRDTTETISRSCVTASGSFRALSIGSHFYYDARKKTPKTYLQNSAKSHTKNTIKGLLGNGSWGRPDTYIL